MDEAPLPSRQWTYPELLDLFITQPQHLSPIFLLTSWTLTPPDCLATDLKSRFQDGNTTVQKNVLSFFEQWVFFDPSPFEGDPQIWSTIIAPWLLPLLHNLQFPQELRAQVQRLISRFLQPHCQSLWGSSGEIILYSSLFDPNSPFFHTVFPREILAHILSYFTLLFPLNPTVFPLANFGIKPKSKKSKGEKTGKKDKKKDVCFDQTLLLDIDLKILAEQLTEIDSRLFLQIRPHELYSYVYKKPQCALNVYSYLQHFENIHNWIVLSIVTVTDLKTRVKTAEKFIQLLQELFQLRNYSGCTGVVAALNSSPVARLKSLDQMQKKFKKMLAEYTILFGPNLNLKQLRALCTEARKENTPFVPYLGITLQDLSSIADGVASVEDGKVNWLKNEVVYQILMDHFSAGPYSIQPITSIQERLLGLEIPPKSATIDWSFFVEPRAGSPPVAQPAFTYSPK